MTDENEWVEAPSTGTFKKLDDEPTKKEGSSEEKEEISVPRPSKSEKPKKAPRLSSNSLLVRLRWQLVAMGFGFLLIAGAGIFFIIQQILNRDTSAPPEVALSQEQVFTEALVGEVRYINPLLASNQAEKDISSLVFSGLTRIDEFGQPVPDLATEWEISEDGLTYTFTLREDATWHDGEPVTAEDVIFTFELLRDPEFTGSPSLGRFWQTVETYIEDEYTVRFVLTQPLTAFPEYAGIGILPQHWLQGVTAANLEDNTFNLDPIGSGRMDWTGIEPIEGNDSSRVILQPYAGFYDEERTVSIDAVVFNVYEDPADAFASLGPRSQAMGGLTSTQLDATLESERINIYTARVPAYTAIVFNQTDEEDLPFFQEPEVRTALALGLDKAQITDNYDTMTIETNSPIMPGTWAYNAALPVITYSPQAAQQQLELIGWADTGNVRTREGQRLSFTLLATNRPIDESVAQAIRDLWRDIGVGVDIDTVSPERFISRLEDRDFDAALVEYSQGGIADPDPYAFWHDSQIEDGQNFSGVQDRDISEYLEIARRDPNGVRRAELYMAFQQRFIDQMVAIPLFNPAYHYAVSCQVIGVQAIIRRSPSDRFNTIHEWHIATPEEIEEVCP